METTRKETLLRLGTVTAAIGASLCCILPVAVAVLGIGSAAAGAKLEPLRPYFVGLTVVLLGYAFYQAYRPRECELGEACAIPESRRRSRILLWGVTLVAVLLLAFPYYVSWLL
jgi:mercuric ion transport protein